MSGRSELVICLHPGCLVWFVEYPQIRVRDRSILKGGLNVIHSWNRFLSVASLAAAIYYTARRMNDDSVPERE